MKIVFALFCALSALASWGCSHAAVADASAGAMPAVAVRIAPAMATDVPLEAAAIGNVEAIASVDVKSRVAGPILRVNFQEGQDVQKGQLLFDIDPEPLNRQIAELEANVARDVANEKQAAANILKDEATLKNAQSIAARAQSLAKDGIFSREQTDQVIATADTAKASLEADKAALESSHAANKADSARLAQTRLQFSYTKITAPISGRVGTIAIKQGNLVKDNDTTLVTILQVNPIYVSFAVPENLLPEIRKYNANHPLVVTAVAANGTESKGTLQFIDSSVDMTTGTIKMKASFENSARLLWPGQFVNVRARLSVEHDRVLVPSKTIQTGPKGKYVWVMGADSTANMHDVQVLRNYTPASGIEQAVVASGIKAGDKVVLEGQMRLAPGAKVRVLDSAAPAS